MIGFSLRKRLRTADGEADLSVAMEMGEGDFHALFGKSGAGKTTVLRMLAGLAAPDEGHIRVGGEIWYDSARGISLPPEKRRAGLVFQDYALFPHLSVRGNLEFALRHRGDLPLVEELLVTCELLPLQHRRPDSLSGGERQRVALARALVNRPALLLLDEPFSAVDAALRARLRERLLSLLRASRTPALLVSHDVAEVCRLCPRVYVLEKGAAARSGPPAEVFAAAGNSGAAGRFRVAGIVLDKRKNGMVWELTVLSGEEAVRVDCPEQEAAELRPGDKVLLVAQAFQPLVLKLQ
jgi:molybdate transport system ATP-binding protein